MSTLLWLLTIILYTGTLFYLFSTPPAINFWAILISAVLGAISLGSGKKIWSLFSFGVIFLGMVVLYPTFLARNWLIFWAALLAGIVFLAVLSLKDL